MQALNIFLAVISCYQIQVCLAQSSWRAIPDAPVADGRHDDVFFVSPSVGWIVNVGGEIYRTADGGRSWVRQVESESEFGFRVFFRSVGFASEQLGWAGNLNSTNNPGPMRALFETRDGGQTWTNISDRIAGPEPVGLCGLWVVNEQIIYGVGRWSGPAIFIKSVDGGNSWTAKDMSLWASGLVDVFFFNPDSGLVVGGLGIGPSLEEQEISKAVILFTADAGNTWETRYTSETEGKNCWKISFPAPDTGYVATQGTTLDGVILKTTDRGRSWKEKTVTDGVGFSGIGFTTGYRGWVGAHPEVYETNDGGETWQSSNGVGININRFRVLNDTLAYAVGQTVYKYSSDSTIVGVATEDLEIPQDFRLEQNYPNPFNPSTRISYTISAPDFVSLRVYDQLGREAALLVNEFRQAGSYAANFDASGLASGIYFYKLQVGERFVQVKKMLFLR